MYKDILSDDELNALLKSDELREEKESPAALPPEQASLSMSEMERTVADLRHTVSRLVRRVEQLERELSELRDKKMAMPRSLGEPPSIRGAGIMPAELAEVSGAGTPSDISADLSGGGDGRLPTDEKPQGSEPDAPLGPRSQRHGKRKPTVKKLF